MTRFLAALSIIFLGLVIISLLTLFSEHMIPGMLLWWIFHERCHSWIGGLTALAIALILRLSEENGSMRFGGASSHGWLAEALLALVSWAIGSILVSAGSRIPGAFPDEWGTCRLDARH